MAKKDQALEPQQERFCREFIKDLHGTEAAIRAGYSEHSAAQQASRLLRNEKIWKRVEQLRGEQFKRMEVSQDRVLKELQRLGFSDIRQILKEDGTVKDPKDWPQNMARAVRSIEVEEIFEGHGEERTWTGYTKKITFWDKPKSLELLGKHLKLFTEKVEHSATGTLAEILAGTWKKEGEE